MSVSEQERLVERLEQAVETLVEAMGRLETVILEQTANEEIDRRKPWEDDDDE